MNQDILNLINFIETGNFIDAEATFDQLISQTVDDELGTVKRAVALNLFGESSVSLNELRDTTLKSYIDKVEASAKGLSNKTPSNKIWKRTKGVVKASKKLSAS